MIIFEDPYHGAMETKVARTVRANKNMFQQLLEAAHVEGLLDTYA